jgi:hypothetical protein
MVVKESESPGNPSVRKQAGKFRTEKETLFKSVSTLPVISKRLK